MNDKNSNRLQELLDQIEAADSGEEPEVVFNSHALFQEAFSKIKAESDINLVKEIAIDYLNYMCMEIPDFAAAQIYRRMNHL